MFTFRALHNLYLFRPNQRSPSKSETRRLWTPRLRKCMFSGNFRNPERFPDSSIHEARYRCSRYEEALLRRYLLLVAISTTAFSIQYQCSAALYRVVTIYLSPRAHRNANVKSSETLKIRFSLAAMRYARVIRAIPSTHKFPSGFVSANRLDTLSYLF